MRQLPSVRFISVALVWSLATAVSLAQGAKSGSSDVDGSCRDFVQAYYDWYVPKINAALETAHKTRKPPARDLGLGYKDGAFSAELIRALREDFDAQAKVRGEIVGLDFDPFLGSQDPCERYVAESVTPKGGSYWVEVFDICSGKKSDKPSVIPELQQRAGQWVFTNFHYGKAAWSDDVNLLSTLKTLKEERLKTPH